MQGTVPGARRRGRPRTAWMDNIKTWTGLPVEESTRMREDMEKMENRTESKPTRRCRTAAAFTTTGQTDRRTDRHQTDPFHDIITDPR